MKRKPGIDMERVFSYICACDRRNWRPVFTLEQFRAIYQAIADNPAIPNTDALPTDRDRVTLYGVAITVSDRPRPPMPEDMLDSAPPVRDLTALKLQAERVRKDQVAFNQAMGRRQVEVLTLEEQAERMYPGSYRSGYTDGSYEAHDLPPRSM
jgi:hypothetical protein